MWIKIIDVLIFKTKNINEINLIKFSTQLILPIFTRRVRNIRRSNFKFFFLIYEI